ncbi:MAG: hypothetical protein K2K74_02390 [Lachnospiraceae bacterium]|nr:hypothetical protein [Lachnospiraceae bacterium]
MEKIIYITDEEREKCQQVVSAFAELYELTDVIVVDAGKYGFVKLQYYREPQGFEVISTFTDSGKLFDALWQDWLEEQILSSVLGTSLEELEYEEIFALLPKEKQEELIDKKTYFESKVSFRILPLREPENALRGRR